MTRLPLAFTLAFSACSAIAILTTSVMAAPCGLYLAKILLPETEQPVTRGQVRVEVRDAVVTLRGLLRDERERHMAESDAWFVFAVDDVVNEIRTGAPSVPGAE